MARIVAIMHRVKKTREGVAKPTMVAIKENDNIIVYQLKTETDEYDFSKARFSVEWRKVGQDEKIQWFDKEKNPGGIRPHQCQWEILTKVEEMKGINPDHIRILKNKKRAEKLVALPVKFDGLKKEDKVVTIFGGSGYIFAGKLSIEGDRVGACVYCLSPQELAARRGGDKKEDHLNIVKIFEEMPYLFHGIRPVDRGIIRAREALSLRQAAQEQRKKRQQQVWHSLKGRVFLDEEGNYGELEGELPEVYKEAQEKDVILQNLWKQEEEAEKGLKKSVQGLPVWEKIFKDIEGCGERIAAGILTSIGDIRRFMAPNGKARLKAFCGAHVMFGGKYGDRPKERQFPRRRKGIGEKANWSPEARQSLYLLAEQFNRRPDTEWGRKLFEYKMYLWQKYPQPIEAAGNSDEPLENGENDGNEPGKKKRYTKGHLLKMALRHTITKFVEWVYKEWVKLEKENQQ
ncbi:MAG: hypothetical protein HYT36_02140 [Candidatus Staskawiczbacteria bacterium]|nr:hypothetical protein [Candidatus Staskawiczbacteria bacterium]